MISQYGAEVFFRMSCSQGLSIGMETTFSQQWFWALSESQYYITEVKWDLVHQLKSLGIPFIQCWFCRGTKVSKSVERKGE